MCGVHGIKQVPVTVFYCASLFLSIDYLQLVEMISEVYGVYSTSTFLSIGYVNVVEMISG